MTSSSYNRNDLYLPDFKFERVAGRVLTLIGLVVLLIFGLIIGMQMILEGKSWQSIWSEIPLFDFLFFAAIFGGAYYYLLRKKARTEKAIRSALLEGKDIMVTIQSLNLNNPSEERGRTMDMDFGNNRPVMNRQTFHDIDVTYHGSTLKLPAIPRTALDKFSQGQQVKVLYSKKYPEQAFLIRDR